MYIALLQRPLGPDLLYSLDLITDLQVLEELEADTTLTALAGFVDVFLPMFERFKLACCMLCQSPKFNTLLSMDTEVLTLENVLSTARHPKHMVPFHCAVPDSATCNILIFALLDVDWEYL